MRCADLAVNQHPKLETRGSYLHICKKCYNTEEHTLMQAFSEHGFRKENVMGSKLKIYLKSNFR